jgi:hypothetical protein
VQQKNSLWPVFVTKIETVELPYTTKMTVFLDVTPCSLAEVYQFQGTLVMEAASTSETSLNFYQSTRRNIPEDSYLQIRLRESL